MKLPIIALTALLITLSCNREEQGYDATGTFEATATIVSSEVSGRINKLNVQEGRQIPSGKMVGIVDTTSLNLKKRQIIAQIEAVNSKLPNINQQTDYLQQQAEVNRTRLEHLISERNRIQNLVKANAATTKQLDDINAQINETRQQIKSVEKQYQSRVSSLSTQTSAIKSEIIPLKVQLEQIEDQINRCKIINQVDGTVLTKYMEKHEITTVGKPIYKIADLSTMILRAYISGSQLQQIKIGQKVKVFIDGSGGNNKEKSYQGDISWISDKSEFTPKTIQTKDERDNLVYAIKVRVKNDGFIKIGMYGEVLWDQQMGLTKTPNPDSTMPGGNCTTHPQSNPFGTILAVLIPPSWVSDLRLKTKIYMSFMKKMEIEIMKDPTITAKNITRTYEKGKVKAVTNVSFSVQDGEIFGLIGPDGAGKTSIFRILTTLLLPNTGTATIAGWDIVKDYKKIRKIVGYMPGNFSLYQDLTVEENLQFFATVFGTSIEENYELIEDIYVQLSPFKDRRAGNLSGGMKQKLALCCALIHHPRILFLDEPTTGVDPVSRKEFWEMLNRLKQKNITILVSTPYMDEASMCDRIALIQNGNILTIDPPEAIIQRYPRPLYALRSNQKSRTLHLLREYRGIQDCYVFGENIHLSFSTHATQENLHKLHTYLTTKDISDVKIYSVNPTVEDCFIEMLSN